MLLSSYPTLLNTYFRFLTNGVRHKCAATFPTITFLTLKQGFTGLAITGMAPHLLAL